MNITIGSHRIRDHKASYVLDRKQRTKTDRVSWRPVTYPTTLAHGFDQLLKYEFKERSLGCTELQEAIELLTCLSEEIRASVQPLDVSIRQSWPTE